MIAKIEMKLKSSAELNWNMASLFHGVLMELIPEEYAEEMHYTGLHPYTQHLEKRGDDWYWVVTALNRNAVTIIIRESLMMLSQFTLKHSEIQVDVLERVYKEFPLRILTQSFYEEKSDKYVQIRFVTPTAFKSQGKYLFFPDIRCIYQSLMNKYEAANGEESMTDEDTLMELTEKTEIIRYELRSTSFSLEGTRIPAFLGKVTFRINGTQTMTNFANMLFQFGEYSGVGIKTSIGMGAISIIKEGGRSNDRKSGKTGNRQSLA